MSMVNSGLSLEVRLDARLPTLSLSYRLSNKSGRDWGVFSRIPATRLDGTPSYAPAAIYVDIDDDTLQLGKYVLPLPPGLQVTYRVVPGITVLPSGEQLAERILLPVPVPADNPYRRASLSGANGGATIQASRPGLVRRMCLQIGAFPIESGEKLLPLSPSFPGVFRVWPPGPATDAQLILAAELSFEAPLPILDYEVAP